MLSVTVDEANLIAVLEPDDRLSEEDFRSAAKVIDPVIETHGHLAGLIVHTRAFPGWQSFAAMCSHLRFVRDHHEHVSRVALVTDSPVRNLAQPIASHFVKAEIGVFGFDDLEAAKRWILDDAAG